MRSNFRKLVLKGAVVVACVCVVNLYSAFFVTHDNGTGNAYLKFAKTWIGTYHIGNAIDRSKVPLFETKIEGFTIYRYNLLWKVFIHGSDLHGEIESKKAKKQTDVIMSLGICNNTVYCDGSIEVGWNFLTLRNVLVDPSKGQGRPGGEELVQVIDQRLSAEEYVLKKGYFVVHCQKDIAPPNVPIEQISELLKAVSIQKGTSNNVYNKTIIALVRLDYANIYHSMMDFYSVFLLAQIKELNPKKLTILLLDSHPRGLLDSIWTTLYGHTIRAGHMRETLLGQTLIFNEIRHRSLLNKHELQVLPYVEEFRQFVLKQYNVYDDKTLNCSSINFVLILRRDYVAHARNPSGRVHRKIANEQELLSAGRKAFPGDTLRGVVLDELSMADQLKTVAKTDVLIGVHGAGLTHTLFLPSHAGVIEFYPSFLGVGNAHFRSMAKWRQLLYMRWANEDPSKEQSTLYITLLPSRLVSMMRATKEEMCSS